MQKNRLIVGLCRWRFKVVLDILSKIAVEESSKIEIGDCGDGGEGEIIHENNNALEDVMDEDVVDLRLFSPIGRLIHVHLLQLPPQAKEVGGWMMQQGLFKH